jgi:hypothetical protein
VASTVPTAAPAAAPPSYTAQQQFIIDSFNSDVYVANRMDVQDTPIYDTFQVAAGITLNQLSSALFTNVGPASGKTYAQTSMTQSQKLAAPEAFSIFGYSLRYQENISLLDIYNVLYNFCFEFYLGQKCYQRGPLWQYNAGGGIFGTSNQAYTGTTGTILNNGYPGRNGMHRLGVTVVIENQLAFYGQLTGGSYVMNAGGNGLTLQALLRGLYARGVQ